MDSMVNPSQPHSSCATFIKNLEGKAGGGLWAVFYLIFSISSILKRSSLSRVKGDPFLIYCCDVMKTILYVGAGTGPAVREAV